jgi:hypothetical protein
MLMLLLCSLSRRLLLCKLLLYLRLDFCDGCTDAAAVPPEALAAYSSAEGPVGLSGSPERSSNSVQQ